MSPIAEAKCRMSSRPISNGGLDSYGAPDEVAVERHDLHLSCAERAQSAGCPAPAASAGLAVIGVPAAVRAELLQVEAVGVVAPVLLGDVVPVLADLAGHGDLGPDIGGLRHAEHLLRLGGGPPCPGQAGGCVPVAEAGFEPACRRGRRRRRKRPTRPMRRARCCSTSTAANGTWSWRTCSRCRRRLLPEVRDCASDFGETRPDLFGGADPHLRHRRRSAGGDHRAGLLHARHDEVDLRHRLLRAAQHRRGAGALAPSAAHHHRLSARRPAHLRAGRRDLHRRRGGAMAARRPASHQAGVRGQRAGAEGRSGGAGLSGAGLRRARRAVLGRRGARRAARADAQLRAGRDRAGRARGGRLPDPRPARSDARRLARSPPTRCCASTAA